MNDNPTQALLRELFDLYNPLTYGKARSLKVELAFDLREGGTGSGRLACLGKVGDRGSLLAGGAKQISANFDIMIRATSKRKQEET